MNRKTQGKVTQRLLSLSELATYLGVGETAARRLLEDGTLTPIRIGPRLIRVDREEVDLWLDNQIQGATNTESCPDKPK